MAAWWTYSLPNAPGVSESRGSFRFSRLGLCRIVYCHVRGRSDLVEAGEVFEPARAVLLAGRTPPKTRPGVPNTIHALLVNDGSALGVTQLRECGGAGVEA